MSNKEQHTKMKDLIPGKLYKLSYSDLEWITFVYEHPKVSVHKSISGNSGRVTKMTKVHNHLYFDADSILSAKPFLYLKLGISDHEGTRSSKRYHFLYNKDEVYLSAYKDEQLFIEIS